MVVKFLTQEGLRRRLEEEMSRRFELIGLNEEDFRTDGYMIQRPSSQPGFYPIIGEIDVGGSSFEEVGVLREDHIEIIYRTFDSTSFGQVEVALRLRDYLEGKDISVIENSRMKRVALQKLGRLNEVSGILVNRLDRGNGTSGLLVDRFGNNYSSG